jgi:hypothetical protein
LLVAGWVTEVASGVEVIDGTMAGLGKEIADLHEQAMIAIPWMRTINLNRNFLGVFICFLL